MRINRRGRGPLLLLSVAGLVLGACGGDDDGGGGDATQPPGPTSGGSTATTAAPGGPATGGTLKIITYSENANFTPESHHTSNPVHDFVYDRLFAVTDTGEVVPGMAESLEPNGDGTWTMKLRSGIEFSDGTPLDAEAITEYWDVVSGDEANLCYGRLDVTVAEWEAVDDLTVKMTPAPEAELDFQFALGGVKSSGTENAGCMTTIGSPTWREAGGDETLSKPVGAGPFLLESWIPQDSMVFVRNPNYWQEGKPYIDRIETKYIGDPQTRCDTFSTDSSYQLLWMGDANPCIGDLLTGGNVVSRPVLTGGTGLSFNVLNEPTDDARIRRAIAYAMDLDDINEKAMRGQTTMVEYFIPESSPFFIEVPSAVNNLEEAQKLVDEYVAEKGGPVVINYLNALPVKHFQDPTIQQLSRLKNVEVEVEVYEGAGISQALNEKKWDIGPQQWAGPTPEIAFAAFKTGASPLWDYSNPALDALIDQAAQETETEAKKALYEQILAILYEDMPGIPLWASDRPSIIRGAVLKDYALRPGTYFSANYESMWLDG